MRKFLTRVCFCLVSSCYFVHILYGATLSVISDKIKLESQIESRIKEIVSSYIGDFRTTVVAQVNLVPEKEKSGKKIGNRWRGNKEVILPGVPAATPMDKKNEQKKSLERVGISAIKVWVTVGKHLSKRETEELRKFVSSALKLNLSGADALFIEGRVIKKSFFKSLLGFFSWRGVISVAFLSSLVFFLFVPFNKFLTRLNENIASISPKPGEAAEATAVAKSGGDVLPEESTSGEKTMEQGGVLPEENPIFGGVIDKNSIENLKVVLQYEPEDVIAKVAQRLPPKIALEVIPRNKMEKVIKNFFRTEFLDPESLEFLFEDIKGKMKGVFGGPLRLGDIVQFMDKEDQEGVLSFLKAKDENFARAVEKRIFRFEDLLVYDDNSLRRIFRKAGIDAFAKCLSSCDKETARSFYTKLGVSITNLIIDRLQILLFTGKDAEAEIHIMHCVEDLAARGFIPPLDEVKEKQMSESGAEEEKENNEQRENLQDKDTSKETGQKV